MSRRLIAYILGFMCFLVALSMVPSLVLAFVKDAAWDGARTVPPPWAFCGSILTAVAVGFLLRQYGQAGKQDRVDAATGFAVAVSGWVLMAGLGAVPYWLIRGGVGDFGLADAFFESVSGFSTTGSSVFGTSLEAGGFGLIESLPASLLFWRSLTHWIGGMGIVVLMLAVLPALRAGGYQMFAAEVPGPTADRLEPRIKETAAILWGVYFLLTAAQTLLLWMGSMPLFDSICHAFGTMATGGFSTKDASIGHYAQTGHPAALYFEMVIVGFMFLAGCNFLLHYAAMHGNVRRYWNSVEFRFYVLVLGTGWVFLAAATRMSGTFATWGTALRQTLFQTLAITTTTGFATTDTNLWPGMARMGLLLLMFFGGCAGSTGGGLKQVRILVAIKFMVREWRRLLLPRYMNPIRVGETTLTERLVANILGLILAWGLVFAGSAALLSVLLSGCELGADGLLVTSTSAVAACLNNIGPGLDAVGSTANYGWMPSSAKLLLGFLMLLGRLEMYAFLVLLLPMTWRR